MRSQPRGGTPQQTLASGTFSPSRGWRRSGVAIFNDGFCGFCLERVEKQFPRIGCDYILAQCVFSCVSLVRVTRSPSFLPSARERVFGARSDRSHQQQSALLA